MNIEVRPGKYVVAVSGGVDSVVLLHLLRQRSDVELVVAHFDHGIRPDSADDARFVAELAGDLPFETERVELGSDASEDVARQTRYKFLQKVSTAHGGVPIILAHHQDDLLETAIHNILRGTGRRGLTSLRSTEQLVRPLLAIPKQALIDYALQQKLSWREDTTNHDERYTRNYIRNRLLVRFDAGARQQLLAIIARLTAINDELDAGLAALLAGDTLDRQWFCRLPHDVSKEVLATWLRTCGIADYDRRTLERLTVQAKTKPSGTLLDVKHGAQLYIGRQDLSIMRQR